MFAPTIIVLTASFVLSFGSDDTSNQPVTLTHIPDQQVDELSELTFTVTATDSDVPADPLAFSLAGDPPAGAAINATTGLF